MSENEVEEDGPVLGDRVRFIGSGAWTGDGEVTDAAIVSGVFCSWVAWDDIDPPLELRSWVPNELLEPVQ